VPRSELAALLRSARHEQGITRSRVGAALGVPAGLVGRWEHGDAVPDPEQVRALAGVLRVGPDTADAWLGLRTSSRAPVTVEIVSSPSSSTTSLIGLVEPAPPPPATGAPGRPGGGARRRADERARRAARTAGDRRRRAVQRAGDEARRSTGRTATGAAELPVFAPDLLEERSHVIATVNSGSVFPVPGSGHSIEKLTYSTGAPTYRVTAEDRMVYRSRWMRVVLIMVGLAALLWWAVAQLGDGWDAVLDLFRSDEAPVTTVEAAVLWLPALRR